MTDLSDIFENVPLFQNDLSQISAKATISTLSVDNEPRWTYSASRVVRNVTALGHLVLDNLVVTDGSEQLSLAAYTTAQAWEQLASLGEYVEPRSALLNASLYYEIAGYQANASCLARLATSKYHLSEGTGTDRLLAEFVQRQFVRLLSEQTDLTAPPSIELIDTSDELSRRASYAAVAAGLGDAARYFLTGNQTFVSSASRFLRLAERGLAEIGDAVGHNGVAGLQALLPVMVQRSTWSLLGQLANSPRWTRYLKILARGLSEDVLNGRSISELWPSQTSAVAGGLLGTTSSYAIRMPTSAGKTRVAEMAIVHTLTVTPSAKCVFIAPYRALANEITSAFSNLFTDLGLSASTVPGDYEQDEMGEELAAEADLLVLTPEKLDLLLRLRSDVLEQVRLIVIDEGHIVADASRGPKFELLISRLRHRIPLARFLMMSAVVPDETLRDFSKWLGGDSGETVSTEWRPSAQRFGRLDWDGARGTLRFPRSETIAGGLEFVPNMITQREYAHVAAETGRVRRPKFPASDSKSDIAAEFAYQTAHLGPVLIFSMQTNWAESIASALLRRIDLSELSEQTVEAPFAWRREGRALTVAIEWLGDDHFITALLRRGIAFHHGRLPDAVRDAIEEDFRARRLAVLVATSTLAQGVNLPVRTVVIHSCRSRDADGSPRILSAREYWNIAGRAGRAGEETEGLVVHISSNPYDVEDFNGYASRRNDVERVESALHHMLRNLVEGRISSSDASEQLDADLLALLVEEDADQISAELLEETLSNSLFQIQALETHTPTEALFRVMTQTATRIDELVPDRERRQVFASTGLSSRSCAVLARHIEAHAPEVSRLLQEATSGDRGDLVDLLLEALSEVREMEPRAALGVDSHETLLAWMDGVRVRDVASSNKIEDPQLLTEYIEDVFSYKLPWGISSYMRIASYLLGVSQSSRYARSFAGMMKYGVPAPEAAWAMTAGVASRSAAITVANEFRATAADRSVGGFRRWLASTDIESLAERLGLTGAELESTARAILRSQPNEALTRFDPSSPYVLPAQCRLLRIAVDSGAAFEINLGDQLNLSRDYDNGLNRNSVLIRHGSSPLAYLPPDLARMVAPEIDSGSFVSCSVSGFDLEARTLSLDVISAGPI